MSTESLTREEAEAEPPSTAVGQTIAVEGFTPPQPGGMELFRAENIINRLRPDVTVENWYDWKWQMQNRLRSLDDLNALLALKPYQIGRFKRLIETFHYSITPYYLSLVNWSDPDDPIRKQCVPDLREMEFRMVGNDDPLEEEDDMQAPGLVHRYPDRVLAIATNVCSMYCRHCTRKRIWHDGESVRTKKELAAMVNYVRQTPKVREVVVSGGDPLTMNIELLDWFLGELKRISHVEVLRIGTRVPVVMPMLVTEELALMLRSHRPLWINTQFNHPREITPESRMACDRLQSAGIPVSNQSVLLRGVNDTVETMKELCNGLQSIMVRPYYLYQCDPVSGVEHFRTSVWTGIEIIEMMRGYTGGLCIPTFVVDAPGGGGKIPLQPFYLLSATDKEIMLRNYEGMILKYYNPPAQETCRKQAKPTNGRNGGTEQLMNGDKNSLMPEDTPRIKRRKQKNSLLKMGSGNNGGGA